MRAAALAFAGGLLAWTGCAEKRPAAPEGYSDTSVRPFRLDLFAAAARGDLPGVQDALNRGAGVDSRDSTGATALVLAAANGSLPVIQTLISAGADVNAADGKGLTPLAAASAGGYDEIARVLRASGARH